VRSRSNTTAGRWRVHDGDFCADLRPAVGGYADRALVARVFVGLLRDIDDFGLPAKLPVPADSSGAMVTSVAQDHLLAKAVFVAHYGR